MRLSIFAQSLSLLLGSPHIVFDIDKKRKHRRKHNQRTLYSICVCAPIGHFIHVTFTNSSGLNLYLSSHCKHMRSTMCGTQMPKHFNMNKRHERHSFSENAQCHFYCPTYHKVHTHKRVRATQLNEMNAMQIQRTHLI